MRLDVALLPGELLDKMSFLYSDFNKYICLDLLPVLLHNMST